jgi:hypothetical protein
MCVLWLMRILTLSPIIKWRGGGVRYAPDLRGGARGVRGASLCWLLPICPCSPLRRQWHRRGRSEARAFRSEVLSPLRSGYMPPFKVRFIPPPTAPSIGNKTRANQLEKSNGLSALGTVVP